MNRIIITGNLARDPESHTTQSGISSSKFDVAVQRRYKGADGQREADFLTVVAWRQTADFCNKYLKKGAKVAVEGSIQRRSYDAQDGSKRWVVEIIADSVESLSRPEGKPEQVQTVGQPDAQGFQEIEDEGLPF